MLSKGELNLHGWRRETEGQTVFLIRSTHGERIPLAMTGRSVYMKVRLPRLPHVETFNR